jgi:hypothetical protein
MIPSALAVEAAVSSVDGRAPFLGRRDLPSKVQRPSGAIEKAG